MSNTRKETVSECRPDYLDIGSNSDNEMRSRARRRSEVDGTGINGCTARWIVVGEEQSARHDKEGEMRSMEQQARLRH